MPYINGSACAPGDWVRILAGPYAGHRGQIVETTPQGPSVRLSSWITRKVPPHVVVPFEHVRPAASGQRSGSPPGAPHPVTRQPPRAPIDVHDGQLPDRVAERSLDERHSEGL